MNPNFSTFAAYQETSSSLTTPPSGLLITYAKTDGKLYTKNSSGTEVEVGGGGSITTSDTPPVSPSAGDLWFNSENGSLYVYYVDGNSQQWVSADNSDSGFTGALSPTTTQGDIIVRGASADERLGIGAPGNALRVAASGTSLDYGSGMATRQMFISSLQLNNQSVATGTGAFPPGISANQYWSANTGTTTTGGSLSRLAPQNNRKIATLRQIAYLDMEGPFRVPTLSNVTDTYTIYIFGTTESIGGNTLGANGFHIRITESTVELVSRASNINTVAAGTASVSANVFARFRMTFDGVTLRAYKDGVEFANLSAGFPAPTTSLDLLQVQIIKSSGTTDRIVEFRPPSVGIDFNLP